MRIIAVVLPGRCKDSREGMAFQGSASYYLNRGGIRGSGGMGPGLNVCVVGGESALTQTQEVVIRPTRVFKTESNPNLNVQRNVGMSGVDANDSPFHVENPSPIYSHGMSVNTVCSASQDGEMVKKKRGRPRKYGLHVSNTALGFSPLPASTPYIDEATPSKTLRRGRPPGTGWKQKLAPLGEWMNRSAGSAFTTHVLHIGAGEDIAAKILAFAQQRPRAICILSATGSVSTVTLHQPMPSAGSGTYEGHFEILCLSGSYLIAENGSPRDRTGGISISVSSPEGDIIGGAVDGKLTAANPVQVVACSFVYGSSFTDVKNRAEPEMKDEQYLLQQSAGELFTAATTAQYHPNSGTSLWPPEPQPDIKIASPEFDLTYG